MGRCPLGLLLLLVPPFHQRSAPAASSHVTFSSKGAGMMSSVEIEREDSLDSLDSHLSASLMEAPTLSSKEIERAREQALNVLKTRSAEEAFKVFTSKGSSVVKADLPREEKAGTATMPPRRGGDANASGTEQPPQKK